MKITQFLFSTAEHCPRHPLTTPVRGQCWRATLLTPYPHTCSSRRTHRWRPPPTGSHRWAPPRATSTNRRACGSRNRETGNRKIGGSTPEQAQRLRFSFDVIMIVFAVTYSVRCNVAYRFLTFFLFVFVCQCFLFKSSTASLSIIFFAMLSWGIIFVQFAGGFINFFLFHV